MHTPARSQLALSFAAASVIVMLIGDGARAQRLANGRPARGSQHQSQRFVREVVQEPPVPDPSVPDPSVEEPTTNSAKPETLPAPLEPPPGNPTSEDSTPKLEVIEPAAEHPEPGLETDGDDRFHLGFGQGLGLGRWCRPGLGFGFGGLRSMMPEPQPMTGASWLNRPLHVDIFSGVIYGGPLIEDSIRRQGDMFSGFRLGWDWTRRLGGEMRFGFAQVGTEDIPTGVELDDADVVYWDLNVLWYPTGDTRLRPYLSIGLGAQHVDFVDATNNGHQKELVAIPLAAGLKYRATPWCAVRADIADNIAFPYDDIAAQGNFSITVSAEFHFGGERRGYWPWSPSLQTW